MMKKLFGRIFMLLIALAALVGLGGSMVVTRENEYKLIREFGADRARLSRPPSIKKEKSSL